MNLKLRHVVFVALFSLLALIGSQINFSALLGAENQFFTLFQFFGPIAGGFLGPIVGVASVLIAELINFVAAGKEVELVNVLRLLPMLGAAAYFGMKKKELSAIVSLAAIALFVLHPIGQQVWFFSLYWLIPIVAKFLPDRLFLRSLGATFTAHAIGGVIWIYTVPTTPELWLMLIPIVAYERALFALGITASFVAMNTFLAHVESKVLQGVVNVDTRYVLVKDLFRLRT